VKEFMFLEVSGNDTSSFFSQRKYQSDSTIMAPPIKENDNASHGPDRIIHHREKGGKVFYKTLGNSAQMRIKVNDERKLDWKILNDKQKILNYNTQKASLNFAGRAWNAWFTQISLFRMDRINFTDSQDLS
jgi:GLPGLI family protein